MSEMTDADFETIDAALCDCIPTLNECYRAGGPCDVETDTKPCACSGAGERLARFLEGVTDLRIVKVSATGEGE